MESVVQRLIDTQLPNRYLGSYKESDQFAKGTGWDGPVCDVWTQKYNLIGLLSYYKTMSYEPALDTCRRMADLMYDLYVVQKHSLRRWDQALTKIIAWQGDSHPQGVFLLAHRLPYHFVIGTLLNEFGAGNV